jgi:hypothetical protein
MPGLAALGRWGVDGPGFAVELGPRLRSPQVPHGQGPKLLFGEPVSTSGLLVRFDHPPVLVEHEDDVVGLAHEQCQALGQRQTFLLGGMLAAFHEQPRSQARQAGQDQRQREGQQGLQLERPERLLHVDLGHQMPGRPRDRPHGGQNPGASVIDPVDHPGRSQHGPHARHPAVRADRHPESQDRPRRKPGFVQRHHVVALPPHEHRLPALARGRPGTQQRVEKTVRIQAQDDVPDRRRGGHRPLRHHREGDFHANPAVRGIGGQVEHPHAIRAQLGHGPLRQLPRNGLAGLGHGQDGLPRGIVEHHAIVPLAGLDQAQPLQGVLPRLGHLAIRQHGLDIPRDEGGTGEEPGVHEPFVPPVRDLVGLQAGDGEQLAAPGLERPAPLVPDVGSPHRPRQQRRQQDHAHRSLKPLPTHSPATSIPTVARARSTPQPDAQQQKRQPQPDRPRGHRGGPHPPGRRDVPAQDHQGEGTRQNRPDPACTETQQGGSGQDVNAQDDRNQRARRVQRRHAMQGPIHPDSRRNPREQGLQPPRQADPGLRQTQEGHGPAKDRRRPDPAGSRMLRLAGPEPQGEDRHRPDHQQDSRGGGQGKSAHAQRKQVAHPGQPGPQYGQRHERSCHQAQVGGAFPPWRRAFCSVHVQRPVCVRRPPRAHAPPAFPTPQTPAGFLLLPSEYQPVPSQPMPRPAQAISARPPRSGREFRF